MINQVHLQNFKLLRDVTLDFGRLNVIVGRNGIGKSSVLEGLHLLLQCVTQRHDKLFVGPRDISQLLSKPDAQQLGLSVVLDDGRLFELQVVPVENQEAMYRFTWTFGSRPSPKQLILTPSSDQSPSEALYWSAPAKAGLNAVVRLRLSADALAADHYSEEERPRVAYDGTGLASVLQYLQARGDGTVEAIESELAALVPGVKRIRTDRVKIRRSERIRVTINDQESWSNQWRDVIAARLEVEFDGLGWIAAEHLSEGTLLALGLLTVLTTNPPRLVLLDDIDKALHPLAQQGVITLLRRVLERQPQLQIVATSHSPFVLDQLRPEEVFIAGPVSPTETRVRRLDTHPGWERRSGYMLPGEFWTFVGEGWVSEVPR